MSDVLDAIARNVRQLRIARGMSQAELGKRADLSRQAIVLLEGGRSNASVATLAELASSLGVTLVDLVDVNRDAGSRLIRAGEFRELWSDSLGSHAKLIVASEPPGNTELWWWSLAPGAMYEGAGEKAAEYIYLVNGRIELAVDGELLSLNAGDAAQIRRGAAYQVTAVGRASVRYVLMFVPV